MNPFDVKCVRDALSRWLGQNVYVHLEVNPGAYWRNGYAELTGVHVKGDGPYRLFLEFSQSTGLIQVDDLTHMSITETQVICSGYDEQHRLARSVEVSCLPFSMV
jgi:Protein of unknown function (DUF1806)